MFLPYIPTVGTFLEDPIPIHWQIVEFHFRCSRSVSPLMWPRGGCLVCAAAFCLCFNIVYTADHVLLCSFLSVVQKNLCPIHRSTYHWLCFSFHLHCSILFTLHFFVHPSAYCLCDRLHSVLQLFTCYHWSSFCCSFLSAWKIVILTPQLFHLFCSSCLFHSFLSIPHVFSISADCHPWYKISSVLQIVISILCCHTKFTVCWKYIFCEPFSYWEFLKNDKIET